MSQSVKMFFQVVLPRTLQLGKLEIPPKFVLLYGETFLSSNSIILMAPNGDTWPVTLEKNDGSIMMGKGWTKFADHYSVGAMSFIMFEYIYHRKSLPVFNVLILKDSTGMEIPHYPIKHHSSHVIDNHQRVNGLPASFQKCQSIRNGKCYLGIPLEFIQKAKLCNEETLLLKGETGVEWEVKLTNRVQFSQAKTKHGAAEHKRYNLGHGWKAFRDDNDIANADKLKFEHIDGCLIAVTKVV